ncbi:MAG: hypothetical protein HRU28_16900, partial [Rhizobiales bacterium]|nr:hypothetical protein [Hyphomicrobiales bacterium]
MSGLFKITKTTTNKKEVQDAVDFIKNSDAYEGLDNYHKGQIIVTDNINDFAPKHRPGLDDPSVGGSYLNDDIGPVIYIKTDRSKGSSKEEQKLINKSFTHELTHSISPKDVHGKQFNGNYLDMMKLTGIDPKDEVYGKDGKRVFKYEGSSLGMDDYNKHKAPNKDSDWIGTNDIEAGWDPSNAQLERSSSGGGKGSQSDHGQSPT